MRNPEERARLPFPLVLALLAGTAARLAALVHKPLWADETFTLWLARKSVPEILRSLRVDSGPPLHYLVSHVVLLPFPQPGHGDAAVRLVSLVASLLHFPLLLAVGRKLGDARIGARAAALFALFPLAVDFAAEGRAYALASLLVLAALDRALATADRGRARDAVLLALTGGAAALTHYLAVLPVAALALLLPRARTRAALGAGLAGAALVFAPWIPVLVRQPRASMAWTAATAPAAAFARFLANLAFGADPSGTWVAPLAVAGALVLAVALLARRGDVGAVLLGSVALLFLVQAATGTALLPQRSALPLLPYAALVLACSVPSFAASLLVAIAALAVRLLAPPSIAPGEELAKALLPLARGGAVVCAPGLWGPELDYRLASGGAPGHVVLFPAEVARHRGWFADEAADPAALDREARAIVSSQRAPRLYVVPFGGRAGEALAKALEGRSTRVLGKTPLFEVRALVR